MALDYVYSDDPVGAVPVHMFNGIWGHWQWDYLQAKGRMVLQDFYGGGFKQLGIQSIVFLRLVFGRHNLVYYIFILKKTIGLRVSKQEKLSDLTGKNMGYL